MLWNKRGGAEVSIDANMTFPKHTISSVEKERNY